MSAGQRTELVSVHGGHCAEFCSHARDPLEAVLDAYVARGFTWVGITEHVPPARDEMIPPEERAAGLSVADLRERFARYFEKARRLQAEYAGRIDVLVAFEAEIYSDSGPFLDGLIEEFRPDYVVGSVHHVHDISIDSSSEDYAAAAERAGGIQALYCDYFDLQYDLIEAIEPAVVGHFDLIRLLDPNYVRRLALDAVWQRVERNLQKIRALDLILDFNVRALAKGQLEPYVSEPILRRARELGVAVVPGDDSHGADGVGLHVDNGIRLLQEEGFPTQWRRPGAR